MNVTQSMYITGDVYFWYIKNHTDGFFARNFNELAEYFKRVSHHYEWQVNELLVQDGITQNYDASKVNLAAKPKVNFTSAAKPVNHDDDDYDDEYDD